MSFPIITTAIQKKYEAYASVLNPNGDKVPKICGYYGRACRQKDNDEGANRAICSDCPLAKFAAEWALLASNKRNFFSLSEYEREDILEKSRLVFTAGTRIILTADIVDTINGVQNPHAPKAGDKGTVEYVDDAASIHVRWDNGGSLALVYGEDDGKFAVLNENT